MSFVIGVLGDILGTFLGDFLNLIELRPCGLVDDVADLGRRVDDADGRRRQRQLLRRSLQRDRGHLGFGLVSSSGKTGMIRIIKFSKYIFFAVGFYRVLCAIYYKGLRAMGLLCMSSRVHSINIKTLLVSCKFSSGLGCRKIGL